MSRTNKRIVPQSDDSTIWPLGNFVVRIVSVALSVFEFVEVGRVIKRLGAGDGNDGGDGHGAALIPEPPPKGQG